MSEPVGSLPSTVMVVFDPGASCTVYPPHILGGISFNGEQITTPLSGTMNLSLATTPDPNKAKVIISDITQVHWGTIQASGHMVETLEMNILTQDLQMDRNSITNNVYGTFKARYRLLIDGTISTTLDEDNDILCSFDSTTGIWSGCYMNGTFIYSTPVGYNTYWLFFTAISLLLLGGYLIFRQRRKLPQK